MYISEDLFLVNGDHVSRDDEVCEGIGTEVVFDFLDRFSVAIVVR